MAKKKSEKNAETEETTEKKGGKKLILIVAALVLLAGGGGSAFMMTRPDPAEVGGEAATKVVDKGRPGLVSMETFMVNIYHPDGDRHAKLKLDLAVVPAAIADTIAGDTLLQAKLRDRVLTLLTSKSFDELRSPVGKEGFRREVKARLNPLFEGIDKTGGEIEEVLFSEFVVR